VARTFDGAELNTEYLFGLFANLQQGNNITGTMSLLGIPMSYEITHFSTTDNMASASTVVMFNFPSVGEYLPVQIDTWNMWDSSCKIIQYDATLRWFGYLVDTLLQGTTAQAATADQQDTISYLKGALATSICNIHDANCLGRNKQYSSNDECVNFLTKQVRFGAAYELGRNTVLCRMVHQNMVMLRPEVHCAHIGRDGGGMCADDVSYDQKVKDPFFSPRPFMPGGQYAGAV
jgi:hypothetical protein